MIWRSEPGIRGSSEPRTDCMDVLRKLEGNDPELAGFVFWSDEGTTMLSATTTVANSWNRRNRRR